MLLNDAIAVFNVINSEVLAKEMPVSLAFKLEKILDILRPDIDKFYKLRKNLIEKYGTLVKAPEGEEDTYDFTPENQKIVNAELDELVKTEIPFDEALKISSSLFDNISMKGNAAIVLKSILKD